MARRSPSAVVGAVLVSCAALAAQQRAACTGVLRTADGSPLAGAEVTFAFEPGIVTPGEPDRVAVTTGADGHFAADLVAGNVYTVWAIGPADDQGLRSMCRPAANAAAGWPLELVAADRRGPVRVRVAGTAPWIAEGPLALRVFLAGAVALKPDVPLPGDGPIALPPCPCDLIALALLDGRGSMVDVESIDLTTTTKMEIAAPREFEVVVHDERGALQGARVVQTTRSAGPGADLLLPGGQTRDRVVGTTDAAGKAKVRAFFSHDGAGSLLLRAEAAGHAPAVAGWLGSGRTKQRSGAIPADDDPLEFELATAAPVEAHVIGLPEGARASAWYRQELGFSFANGGGVAEFVATEALPDGVCTMAPTAGGTFLRLGVADSAGSHTSAWFTSQGPEPPPADLGALRIVKLVIVDEAGQPHPGVQIGVTFPGSSQWVDRFALPADGRITLKLPLNEVALYATTETAHGVALVGSVPPAELRMVLQPIPVVAIRVVDDRGTPVAGARLVPGGGSFGSPRKDRESTTLDDICFFRIQNLLGLARSDANGALRLPLPLRDGSRQKARARAGARVSKDFTLQASTDVQEVIVR